jgi:hypothetical protein
MGGYELYRITMTNRSALTALLVVAAVVLVTVPAGALPAMSADASVAAQEGDRNASNASNASFGASVSGFMQASAADAEGDVEDGMFTARFNNASAENRKDLVRGRANNLEKRLEQLREQRSELLDRTDGDLTLAERAKAARLTARINALEASIDTTSVAAERAGVDSARLQQLRSQASELNGSEVSEMAHGLAGVGRDDTRGQSSQDHGSPDGEPQGNSSNSDSSDDKPSGPGDNPGQGNANDGAATGNTSSSGQSAL